MRKARLLVTLLNVVPPKPPAAGQNRVRGVEGAKACPPVSTPHPARQFCSTAHSQLSRVPSGIDIDNEERTAIEGDVSSHMQGAERGHLARSHSAARHRNIAECMVPCPSQ